jgi:hypothetical protein
MQREFLEYYLNAPITGAFSTFSPLRLPEDLKAKLSLTKIIEDDMTGKEAEVLGLLSAYVEDMVKIKTEHEHAKCKPVF